eukprot:UN25085
MKDTKKPEYEGKTGKIVGVFNKAKKRWPVMIDKIKKKVNLETKNLKKRPDEAFDDFASLAKKLPTGKSDEDRAAQKKMFDDIDASGSDQISLAEFGTGVLQVLGQDVFMMKDATRAAFKASKGLDSKGGDSDYVDRSEFRVLLVNLARYLELWAAFDSVDTGGDDRIDFEEFKASIPVLEEWGIKVEDPEKEFSAIDGNAGGQVLFNEFSDWALKKGLDYDQSFDAGDAVMTPKTDEDREKERQAELAKEAEEAEAKRKKKEAKEAKAKKRAAKKAKKLKQAAGLDKVMKLLPSGATDEDKSKRRKLFRDWDVSGNKSLSLAEIQTGVLGKLGEEFFLMKRAIKEAYKAAKNSRPDDEDKMDQHFVDRKEFKCFDYMPEKIF